MKVTLKDIATDTGYSVSTVSRVLNGSSKISQKTREEVLQSAEKHGYTTPRVRNAQNSTSTMNIALVGSGFHEGDFYVSFFHGLNQAAHQNNIRLFLLGVLDPREQIEEVVREITFNYYDGLILYIPEFTRADYEKVQSYLPKKFPVISNAFIENPVLTTITFDNYSGGYMAAKHFQDQEFQKVGIINGPKNRAESRFRSNGFLDYVSQQDSMDLTWVQNGDFTFEAGVEAFGHFHQLENKPQAVFACNDDMSNGFMEAAKQHGYNFPDDIALIGFDDLPLCRHNQPSISSVSTDFEELGQATMRIMREKLSNPNLKTNMVSFVPVSIAARESSQTSVPEPSTLNHKE